MPSIGKFALAGASWGLADLCKLVVGFDQLAGGDWPSDCKWLDLAGKWLVQA